MSYIFERNESSLTDLKDYVDSNYFDKKDYFDRKDRTNFEEQMNRDEPGYQEWVAERSCSIYFRKKKYGILISDDPEYDIKLDYMFSKRIKMFLIDCSFYVFLLTENGEVYQWKENKKYPDIGYYSQLIDLRHTRIVQTAVSGSNTFIALTDDERVFYFQINKFNDLSWLRQINFREKVLCISCGNDFFVVITENNKVYTWGINNHGQLGIFTCTDEFIDKPCEVKLEGIKIDEEFVDVTTLTKLFDLNVLVKVACGFTHTLALTDTGNIFGWGGNAYGELDYNVKGDVLFPQQITVRHKMKILDITAMKNVSCAIGEDKLIYVWGFYFEQRIKEPVACEFTSLFDTCNALSARSPTNVKYVNTEDDRAKTLDVIKSLFNNPTDSDLMIKVKERSIYVHKFVLQIRSSYFEKIDQFIMSEDDQDVIRLDQFSYVAVYAYFKFLYTAKIDLSLEDIFDLLILTDAFNDSRVEKSCYKEIKKEMSEENVIAIYRMAQKYNKKAVEEYCFEFFKRNKTNVMKMDSFMNLDNDIKNIFIQALIGMDCDNKKKRKKANHK